ncbi:MAG: carotenoid oxygenase family protein, partial [Acidimicrobiales bacterium]
MQIEVVGRALSTLPADDDHPYRSGVWRPNTTEFDAADLEVDGDLPGDLNGVYLRNTENPLHPPIEAYHPFDGDGMVHAMRFEAGTASYRNRFVRTAGFEAEREAGRSLWAGLLEDPKLAERPGWCARGGMKDASSTDIVVHAGRALTTFYQCGEPYALDPGTLDPLGVEAWAGRLPDGWGLSAHPKVDHATGELLFFNYGKAAPYMHYGVVDGANRLVHYVDIPLPGPRLPHDMAFTENYAILNDFPLFWPPELLAKGVHVPRFHPDLPSRFAVIPRRGGSGDIRWFEAEPTFVLHWINAYEDGDEIVLDGYFEGSPIPPAHPDQDEWQRRFRFLDARALEARPHRWRFDLSTGRCKEEPITEELSEFPTINGGRWGRPYRYAYAMTTEPGWFRFDGLLKLDVETGREERYRFPEGVYGSESPMAPRDGATGEDDGYLVTFVSDVGRDRSECWVFAAEDVAGGPIA